MFLTTMFKFEFDFDFTSIWTLVPLGLLIFFLVFWDVHYFLRAAFHLLWGKMFEKPLNPEDTSTIYGFCSTTDLDIMFLHMNNARYIRELDFARFHFYERTGIYNRIMADRGNIVQSACIIKYRRSIPLFMTYKITTKLIYWDAKALYLEQQFISLKDGFVRAVAFSKQGTTGVKIPEIMSDLLNKDEAYNLTPPPELDHFLNCLESNSVRLRKKEE